MKSRMIIVQGGRRSGKTEQIKARVQKTKAKAQGSSPEQTSLEVIKAFQRKSIPISKQISSLKIKSQKDFELAAELLKELKEMAKEALKDRKSMTGPLKGVIKKIEKHFKPFLDSIKLIEKDTKDKMLQFKKSNKLQQAELVTDLEAGNISHKKFLVKSNKLESATTSSIAQVRTRQVLVINNLKLIPRSYLVPDRKAIEEDLRAGEKIPGCKLVDDNTIAI